jgi:hypothetical protein
MSMNQMAQAYLQPLATRTPFPAQVAYGHLLGDARLNFSPDSLDYVDLLLDSIRKNERPDFATFVNKQENQNFLFVLCFYVGTVVAQKSGQRIAWLDYDQMLKAIPDNATMYPRCFQTAATCILEKSGFFVPLSSICERLFEDPPGKSVRFSAESFMPKSRAG